MASPSLFVESPPHGCGPFPRHLPLNRLPASAVRQTLYTGGDHGQKAEREDFFQAGRSAHFEKGKVQVVNIAGGTVGKLTLEPGWKWSTHVKPIAKTELCLAPHFQYHVSGTIHVKMADTHRHRPR